MKNEASTPIKGYNKYGVHLREKYNGQRVYKVIVDGGFSCPNRDGNKGYGGCTYCNVDSFTPSLSRKSPTILAQIESGMERAIKSYKAEKFIVYFQPNTNTYAPVQYLKTMYDEALSINTEDVVGFSVGTRPDCIDAEKVALLESYCDRFDVDLEMGMESIYDETLEPNKPRLQPRRICCRSRIIKRQPTRFVCAYHFWLPMGNERNDAQLHSRN